MPRIGESGTRSSAADNRDEAKKVDYTKPYTFHGIDLKMPTGSNREAYASECPHCGKENKFSVNVLDGTAECKVCGIKCNRFAFLTWLHQESYKRTSEEHREELRTDRKLTSIDTLDAWGVVRSVITNEWLVPGYSPIGKLWQMYRYGRVWDKGKWIMRLMPTPGLFESGRVHQIHGIPLFNPKKSTVYICEGWGDGMALWETLRSCKLSDDGESYLFTANEKVCLLADANVIALPGCGVFREEWTQLLSGRKVVLLFDNDHEREVNDRKVEPGTIVGMKRIAQMLSCASEKPKSVSYLKWGDMGYDPNLKNGYDIRDALSAGGDKVQQRFTALKELSSKIEPIPNEWVVGEGNNGRVYSSQKNGSVEIEPVACDSWPVLINQWRQAMKWTEGLDRALSCMLATVLSTDCQGEQLWLMVQSPPSGGKTSLCEALSVSKKYVYAKSIFRGFHSGYKTDATGQEDHSEIPRMRGKTFVLKDADTLLQAPNLSQILAEARDLYDGMSRVSYRNGIRRDDTDIRITWILSGTSSLRYLDASELGARFLTCIIMERMAEDLETSIGLRVFERSWRQSSVVSNGSLSSRHDPDMVKAKQLTGGYVEYLRRNAEELMDSIEVSDEYKQSVVDYGQFVAFVRARPSNKQKEVTEREVSFRLIEQFARLTKCLTVVLGKRKVDAEVMRRVRQVALDTARGKTLDIIRILYNGDDSIGVEQRSLMTMSHTADDEIKFTLRFMSKIEVVQKLDMPGTSQYGMHVRWRLCDRMRNLYRLVMDQ